MVYKVLNCMYTWLLLLLLFQGFSSSCCLKLSGYIHVVVSLLYSAHEVTDIEII